MQQVVDLQDDKALKELGVELLAISPDPAPAWRSEGRAIGIAVPMLTDRGNAVWDQYGIPGWTMAGGEPGHTFFLVDEDGKIAWTRDYGAPENGGVMYVEPPEITEQVKDALADQARTA
jgi:peroxiredoxin